MCAGYEGADEAVDVVAAAVCGLGKAVGLGLQPTKEELSSGVWLG